MILCIITLGWAQLGGSSGLIWAYLFLTALVYISGELRCPVSLFAMPLILGKAKLLLLLLSRFSHIRLCATPYTAVHQAPLSLGFSREEDWSGLPFSFSNARKWKVKVKSLSHVRLFATPWTAVYQAPPSMGFSRQEYWSGLPLPSPGRLS